MPFVLFFFFWYGGYAQNGYFSHPPTSSDYEERVSQAKAGDDSSQPQETIPQQHYFQYIGDIMPNPVPFPNIQCASAPIPDKYLSKQGTED